MCKLWTIVVGFVKPRMDKTRDWNSQSRFHFSYTKPASSLIYSIYKIVNIRTVTNISNFLSYMLFFVSKTKLCWLYEKYEMKFICSSKYICFLSLKLEMISSRVVNFLYADLFFCLHSRKNRIIKRILE